MSTDLSRNSTAARAATDGLYDRSARYLDEQLVEAAGAVKAALPAGEGPGKAAAAKLNVDNALALSVGKMLLSAAAAAEDESGMCLGVANAVKGAHKTG
jgi:hypothetical protein